MPNRKWWATQVTAASGFLTAWVLTGHWNQQLSITAITLVGQALVGYLVPNTSPTPAASESTPVPTGASR
jgi:hypothetical protein